MMCLRIITCPKHAPRVSQALGFKSTIRALQQRIRVLEDQHDRERSTYVDGFARMAVVMKDAEAMQVPSNPVPSRGVSGLRFVCCAGTGGHAAVGVETGGRVGNVGGKPARVADAVRKEGSTKKGDVHGHRDVRHRRPLLTKGRQVVFDA